MEGERMDAYVLKDIARLEAGGKNSAPCAPSAFLEYYSRHGDEEERGNG